MRNKVETVTSLVAAGADLERRVQRCDYDVEQSATALGWAVRTWCSPALIKALITAGASIKSRFVTNGSSKTLLQLVITYQKLQTGADTRMTTASRQSIGAAHLTPRGSLR